MSFSQIVDIKDEKKKKKNKTRQHKVTIKLYCLVSETRDTKTKQNKTKQNKTQETRNLTLFSC